MGDLDNHKRVREYQADFLLYSIIDKVAEQFTPIYKAYAYRLRYLQHKLESGKMAQTKQYVDEVTKVFLELQELKQWVGQMKRIVSHLENDCKDSRKNASGKDVTKDERTFWILTAKAKV